MPSPQPSQIICELQNCVYCAHILENPELELSDSDSYESDTNGVYEFTQDLRHGDQRDHVQKGKTLRKKEKEVNKICKLWGEFTNRLKRIVDSKYFNRGIMIAILINTLSMGIEYHEQVGDGLQALS